MGTSVLTARSLPRAQRRPEHIAKYHQLEPGRLARNRSASGG